MASVNRAASWSAARGFGLHNRCLVARRYLADMLLLDDLETCVAATVIRPGRVVTDAGFAARALAEPSLELAFPALPVIPHLKLTDMGLVDVDRCELVGG